MIPKSFFNISKIKLTDARETLHGYVFRFPHHFLKVSSS